MVQRSNVTTRERSQVWQVGRYLSSLCDVDQQERAQDSGPADSVEARRFQSAVDDHVERRELQDRPDKMIAVIVNNDEVVGELIDKLCTSVSRYKLHPNESFYMLDSGFTNQLSLAVINELK